MLLARKWKEVFDGKFVRDHCMLKRWEIKLETDVKPLVTIEDIYGDNKINSSVAQMIVSNYNDSRIEKTLAPNAWADKYTIEASAENSVIQMPSASRAVIGQKSECFRQETINVDVQTRARDFISRALNGIGQPPEKFQSAFILTVASILLPNVVGEMEWREIGPILCREMGWNFMNTILFKYVLAQASRRLGKTRGTSELILNYVLSTPDTHCLVYSNSDAQTQLLRDDIHHLIDIGHHIYVGNQKVVIKDLIITNSSKKMVFRNPYNPKTNSVIHFIPGINSHTMDQRVRSFTLFFTLSFLSSAPFGPIFFILFGT